MLHEQHPAGPVASQLSHTPPSCTCALAQKHVHRCCCHSAAVSVQLLLLVGGDHAVRGGVCHAREHEAVAHLLLVEEGLVALVNGARLRSGEHSDVSMCTVKVCTSKCFRVVYCLASVFNRDGTRWFLATDRSCASRSCWGLRFALDTKQYDKILRARVADCE